LRFARTSRCEAAEGAQRQRHLRLQRQRRVATGEDQPQPVVGDFVGVEIRLSACPAELLRGVGFELFREPRLTPQPVDGLVAGCLDDPGARKVRHSRGPPLVYCDGKGFLRRLLGHLEVPHEANQGRDDPAPIGAIDLLDGLVGVRLHGSMVKESPGCVSIPAFAVRLNHRARGGPRARRAVTPAADGVRTGGSVPGPFTPRHVLDGDSHPMRALTH
jgi:hypothetical protein